MRFSMTVLVDAPTRAAADRARARILDVLEGSATSVSASEFMTEQEAGR